MERIRKQVKKGRRHLLASFRVSHPYVFPAISITLATLLSCALIIATNGQVVGASDSRLVYVIVDGQKQLIPTRAATVGELLSSMKIELSPEDIVAPVTSAQIIDQNMEIIVKRAQPVTLVDGSRRLNVMSAYDDPRKVVTQSGLTLFPEDVVLVEKISDPLRDGLSTQKYVIKRAIPINLILYGETVQLRTQSESVAQLFNEKGIKPAADDTVQPSLGAKLSTNSVVSIARFGKKIVSEDLVIAAPVEYINDPTLATGANTVKEAGANGKKIVTYEIETKDGREVGRKVIQEVLVSQAVKKVVLRGTRPLMANYNSEGIPARVFCGSPKQRNWKNINVTNAAIGRALAAERGWTGAEFDALLELWSCESGWNAFAGNPYSGAYGIPQSLPASKMATAGDDYMTNPKTQIIWGLQYIARGYKTPSGALAKHYRSNWY